MINWILLLFVTGVTKRKFKIDLRLKRTWLAIVASSM